MVPVSEGRAPWIHVAELTGLTILPQVGPVSFCTSPSDVPIIEGFRNRGLASHAQQIVARVLLVHTRVLLVHT